VADAKLDSVPLVILTGQVSSDLIGTDAFQEVDTYGMTIPITKHNFTVRSPEELLDVIPRAFRIAASGRPGPVLVDVPKDVQTGTVELTDWPEPGRAAPPPAVDRLRAAEAAAMLDASKRPILYIGGGVIASGAEALAARLAEHASIPAVMTLMGLGALGRDHPLSLGMLGMHAAPYANLAMEECDLLVAVGTRFDDRATGKVERFCPTARIIHIDIDPVELDKLKNAHVGIAGDAALVLDTLLGLVKPMDRRDWLDRIAELKSSHPMRMDGLDDAGAPYGLIREAARLAGEEAIVVTDVGQHQMWTAQAHPFLRPRRWLTSGGLGTMGFGLPAAIGAALANPDRTVVLFSGDGSLLMNIQELATAVEQAVNVKIVLMDNRSLGLVRQQQDLFYGGRNVASVFESHPDFAAIARGFGMRAVDLAGAPDPAAALALAFAEPGPCLVHVPIDGREKVYPMVPPGAANNEMLGGDSHDLV
jgi:acetolactate synthase-1/2/3 large subunit